jgi:hypothetical protein
MKKSKIKKLSALKAVQKPDKFPKWAMNLVQDASNKEFNRYEPPQAKKDVGWSRAEVPPRQWVNYQWWLFNQWLEYLDAKPPIAPRYETKADLPPASDHTGAIVFVAGEGADGELAYSNGSVWREINDRNL